MTVSRRTLIIAAEALAAVSVALLFLWWSATIDVDPMVRVGQVAGMAQLQFRFGLAAVTLIGAVHAAHRFLPDQREITTRVACAAIAGLATGLVAGGMNVALSDTPYGLWAGQGDYSWMLSWIETENAGVRLPRYYPPANLWFIRVWADLTSQPYIYAVKGFQLIGTALFGPAAYVAWRLILRPVWALGIGVVAAIPLIEPVKPYPQITLVMLIPVLVRLLDAVRRSDGLSWQRATGQGVIFGAGLGALFLLYSGWFVWCAAGFVLALGLLIPRRSARLTPRRETRLTPRREIRLTARRETRLTPRREIGLTPQLGGEPEPSGSARSGPMRGARHSAERAVARAGRRPVTALLGATLATFAAVTWPYLIGLLTETGGAADQYFYFDTTTEPAYFAMWRNDRPGDITTWPPLGEWGYVSLFPLLLIVGIGLALHTGWRRTPVICVSLIAVGAWLVRMWLAGRSYETLTVALYPRTTALLFYSSLILTGFGVLYATVAWRGHLPTGRRSEPVPLGLALAPLLFAFALAGSATIDHYMPGPRGSAGEFALVAHLKELREGGCPRYGAGRGCGDGPPYSSLTPVTEPSPAGSAPSRTR